ncbi:UrvD/REP family ATP-dependent DNA helicase [Microbacterium luticocti]|uniref:UrvD/REP family ATP-dependent DNA helicase n=1 Tax=Microbacterium luticocti TaxID=451764 RepID=UPI0004241860|nr:UrvD/REP family ATP-dependent DNA helicase [Microbacterium luticocti]
MTPKTTRTDAPGTPTARPHEPVPLDPRQRRVAELAADASGTVAGAGGTGKTTALVARLQTLVARDGLHPDEVLVLTPSRPTATALRDRLGLAVDVATSGALAHSITSFAFRLARGHAVHAGAEPPRLLTGGDEDAIIADLLSGDAEDEASGARRWPQWLTADIRATRGFRSEVRAFFAECATLGIDPERLRLLGGRFGVEEWQATASFFAEYLQVRAEMRGAHRDAAGLVREAVGLVRAADAAALGAFGGLRAILVDDAQELTGGGVDLLIACRDRGVPVIAFGDPDIGAGAFRGATPENFARLTAALGPVHVLDEPHRGTAALVDLARAVTAHIGTAGGIAHRRPPTGAAADDSVRALLLRSGAEESDVIARLLRERHVRDGVPWNRCAVIAHDTRQVAALASELSAREVPARAAGPGRPLGTLRPVRDLLRLVELAAVDPDEWTGELVQDAFLGVAGGFDPVQLRRLRTALRHAELRADGTRSATQLLVDGCRHPIEFDLVDTREARRAARLARTLAAVRAARADGATAHELLFSAWEGSGLEREWAHAAGGSGPLAEQAGRDLDAVVALFQAAKRFDERHDDATADPMVFVRGILHSDVAEDRLDAAAVTPAVAVLTPAGALGTEFDTVVIAGVQDGVWPNTRLRGSLLQTWRLADAATRAAGDDAAPGVIDRRRAVLHDELRLFVRAISRAAGRLVVTAVDDDDTGPSPFFEFLPDPQPAGALAEHPLSLRGLVARHRRTLTEQRPAPARAHAAGQLALLADAGVPGAHPDQWYGIAAATADGPLREPDGEPLRVSPSRLQTLETCALDWAIGELGGDSSGATAGLGTIIHAALEHADGTDEPGLWQLVADRWGELEFESAWLERATRTQAVDLVRRLHLYLQRFAASGGALLDAEPHFEVPISIGDGERAVLSGYIDRVERTADGRVVIVDLKTGKREPQTDAKVADNPQLAAYQLAFEAGVIAGTEGADPGGAKLLVLRPTARQKDYAEPWQPPFDDESRAAFLHRIRVAADLMRGTAFPAPYEEHCRDEHAYGLCRIHTIGAVSAS